MTIEKLPDWAHSMVEVHVPVSYTDIRRAIAWCKRRGITPNRKNVAAEIRSWCAEGIDDMSPMTAKGGDDT